MCPPTCGGGNARDAMADGIFGTVPTDTVAPATRDVRGFGFFVALRAGRS